MMSGWDIAIVLLYLAVVLLVGLVMGRQEKDTEDFVIGGRSVPWPAVLLSIVATEISAMTFLGVPGVGFSENLNYLQTSIGSLGARFAVAFVFIGAFYGARYQTVYAWLAERFGGGTRYTASLFFLLTQILGASVRLMVAVKGIAVILDMPFAWCLVGFVGVAIVYTAFGGIKAVIWTDVVQGVVFVTAGLAVFVFLQWKVGWSEIWAMAHEAGRLELFRMRPSGEGWLAWMNEPMLWYVAIVNGFVMTVAALGTDQNMSQRILACRDVQRARRSVILSGFAGIPVTVMFLFIGVGLFAYYRIHAEAALPLNAQGGVLADQVFGYFIRHELPVGLRGLLLAGVIAAAMSSVDSAMSALGSSAMVDLYAPLWGRQVSEARLLCVARLMMGVFGLVLLGVAWLLREADQHLWLAFQMVAITYGPLLGVFLLGLLTRRGSDMGNVVAMFASAWCSAWLVAWIRLGDLPLGWTWVVLIGVGVAFAIGLCFRSVSHEDGGHDETVSDSQAKVCTGE